MFRSALTLRPKCLCGIELLGKMSIGGETTTPSARTAAENQDVSNVDLLGRKDSLATPFRCVENNPTQHTAKHEAKFYTIPMEDYARLFTFGGVLRDHQRKIKSFNEFCLMVRNPALEIMSYLQQTNYAYPVNRYVLYGVTGSGKTMSLAHLIHFCSKQGWLIIHVPWAPIYVRFPKEVVISSHKESRIDLPYYAVLWLQQFKMQNGALLEAVQPTIANTYTWSKRESNEKGSLLTDVVTQGINRIKFSSDCVGAVLKEVKLMASAGVVLVVVDGVNSFFDRTRLKRDDHSPIYPSDISLIWNLKKMLAPDWKNGAVITTVDVLGAHSTMRESHLPRYLLGTEGFEILDPFVPVEVKLYSPKEIDSCLDYYVDRHWIQTEKGRSQEGREQLKFLSGYNPSKLMEICGPY